MQNVTTNSTWTLGVTIIVRHFGHDSSMVTTATAPTPLMGSLTIASLAWVSAGSSRTLVDGDPEADGIDAATITTTALLTASDLVSVGLIGIYIYVCVCAVSYTHLRAHETA